MPDNVSQNEILPFYYSDNLPANTALSSRHFTVDGFEVFALASLYSAQVKNLDLHLKFALDELEHSFHETKDDPLDRMKKSIFNSGDKLAEYLIAQKEQVDDVDYNVCMVAFKDGLVYVWIDGNLGLRMYRGGQSLLINQKGTPQFYGSSTIELGDILALSFNKNIREADPEVEKYVLEDAKPDYPGLFIDYQIEGSAEELPSPNVQMPVSTAPEPISTSPSKMDEEMSRSDPHELPEENVEAMALKRRSMTEEDSESRIQNLKGNLSNGLNKLKDSGVGYKIIEYLKTGLTYIGNGLMAVTSFILDLVFGLIYRNNPHQFKRFQSSIKKKNLQYLMILLIFLLVGYLVFFRLPQNSSNTASNGSNNEQTGNESEVRDSLQTQFELVRSAYVSKDVTAFNATHQDLIVQVASAKDNGFEDVAFLDDLIKQTADFENSLFQVTPVTKIDEGFRADHISNSNIVDFAVVGTDVYAIDRANFQILKSNSDTQKLDVFASEQSLTAMSHIACMQTSCYILDDNLGFSILNLQTKAFSKFSALKDAGKGVKEMEAYLVTNTVYIYTLVPDQGKVLRYTRVGDGLTQPSTWNKSPGFGAGTTDFFIDGGIFEANSSGSIRRFFGGTVEPVTNFNGIEPPLLPLGSDLQITATAARSTSPGVINRFYIADSQNSRIVVYEKDLNTTKQYTFKGTYKYTGTEQISFTGIKQISLSSDEKTIYCLSNNVVFRFSVSAI